MIFKPTALEGVWIIEPVVYPDQRGYFMESFRQNLFEEHIGPVHFIQDNESQSQFGTLRGLHCQLPPHAQTKLVRVVEGEVFDVAVDIRKDSKTFGQYVGVHLSAENKRQFLLPKGFTHGFLTLSESAVFQYKVDAYYNRESESSIRYDDPTLNIKWPLKKDQIIQSPRDAQAPFLENARVFEPSWGK